MQEMQRTSQLWSVLTSLVLVVLTYLYYNGIQSYSTTPKWIGLAILGIILIFTTRKQPIVWSTGLTIWSLFVVQYLLQCFASYNFHEALTHAIPLIIGPVLVITILQDRNHSTHYERLITLLAIITLPLLLYGLYEVVEQLATSRYSRVSSYEIRYSFGHKNQLAQFFTLLIPLYAYCIILSKTMWKKILMACSIVGIYIFITLLMNRTSISVIYGLYPIAAIVFLIHKRCKPSFKRLAYVSLASLVGISILLILVIPDQLPYVNKWLTSDSGNERLLLWEKSIQLGQEFPIWGHGSGDWKIEILRSPIQRPGLENQIFFQRAHNEFLQSWVENGILGVLLLLVFFVYSLFSTIRAALSFQTKLICVTGIMAFFIIANLSFPLERVELIFLLFLFVAPTFRTTKRKVMSSFITYSMFGTLIIILLFSFNWIRQEHAFFNFRNENTIEDTESLTTYSIDPTSTPVDFYCGNYYFERKNYPKAVSHFTAAARYNPYHVHVLNNLASSLSLTGNNDEAKQTYSRLLKIQPTFVDALVNAASVNYNSGDTQTALNHLLAVPSGKEPSNFQLFVTTILRARLDEILNSETLTNSEKQQIQDFTSSDEALLQLFDKLHEEHSIIRVVRKP
jgi:O-antigen ligase